MDISGNSELINVVFGIEGDIPDSDFVSGEKQAEVRSKFRDMLKHLFDEFSSCGAEEIASHSSRTAERANVVRLSVPLGLEAGPHKTNMELLLVRTMPDDPDKEPSYLYELKDPGKTYLAGFARDDCTVITDPSAAPGLIEAEIGLFTKVANGALEDYDLKPVPLDE